MKKVWLWIAGGAALAIILLVAVLSLVKGYFILFPSVQLLLNGEAAVEVEAFSEYRDAGALGRKGRRDLSADVVCEGAVDTAVPGIYTIIYRLHAEGKELIRQRTVTVVDREAPQITLQGEPELTVSARQLYQEPGYTADDRCDGDLTAQVQVQEVLDGEVLTISYTVSDAAGNVGSAQRIIYLRDIVAPTITLYGPDTVYLPVGEPYSDPGYAAADDADGDITAAVSRSGSIDTACAGSYTITYRVSDRAGNRTEAKRTVKVYEYAGNPRDRVYLTFDDGPSSYVTGRVLDTLARYEVKATFFILDYSEGKKPLIARMIREGHTVAIHGYSHDYAKIYASDEAFMDNIYRLQNKLLADFDYRATIIRFPGGSSNTVSMDYSVGIMSRLTQRVEREGFRYFDWNVSSGDASAVTLSSTAIYENVASGLRHGRDNVVLMHDTNAKETTADALDEIIHYARANGYTLLPLTTATPPVHHGVNN